ncbi:MAG: hypothetical protein D3922_11085 [Candidatus Electrothrix sp. AR1]|nr:hypothetical protein [Candidatus Electrothrix sp. AR1]
MKKKRSKPVQLLQAFWGCAVLFCVPGLILTFISPSFTIKLTRVNQERVDATVFKRILLLVPIAKDTATNLLEAESNTMDGGVIREGYRSTGRIVGDAEDQGLLFLRSLQGPPLEVWISPKSLDGITDEIQYFITESQEPSLRLWVVSNWKFGAILPGGILLFCVIVFCLSVRSIMTGKSLEQEGTPSVKNM